jgi:hypothetical protein
MLAPFKGFYGLTTLVQLDSDTTIFVVAEDEPTLERSVNAILNGQREYVPEKTKPCILINPDLFPHSQS